MPEEGFQEVSALFHVVHGDFGMFSFGFALCVVVKSVAVVGSCHDVLELIVFKSVSGSKSV